MNLRNLTVHRVAGHPGKRGGRDIPTSQELAMIANPSSCRPYRRGRPHDPHVHACCHPAVFQLYHGNT
jgi:hypothetical protein